jgi:integrase/recombinase XerC
MPIDKFLNYLQYEKRYSAHTVQSYSVDLRQFVEFCNPTPGSFNAIGVDTKVIRQWVVFLLDNAYSGKSVNRKLSSLRNFFRYLQSQKMITDNPVNGIVSPKSNKRLPIFVDEGAIDFLFDEVDFGDGFEAERDRLILEILYSTGIRLSELTGLTENSFDRVGHSIKVVGKRNKERIVPYSKSLENQIGVYLKSRDEVIGSRGSGSFFVTSKGKAIYPKLVYRTVNHYLSLVSTIKKKSPHVLRHSFATHMLNNGADLNAIKELLGHSGLSATQVYTHTIFNKLKDIYNHAHPRA